MSTDARHTLDALREATILAERARVSGEALTADEADTIAATIATAQTISQIVTGHSWRDHPARALIAPRDPRHPAVARIPATYASRLRAVIPAPPATFHAFHVAPALATRLA